MSKIKYSFIILATGILCFSLASCSEDGKTNPSDLFDFGYGEVITKPTSENETAGTETSSHPEATVTEPIQNSPVEVPREDVTKVTETTTKSQKATTTAAKVTTTAVPTTQPITEESTTAEVTTTAPTTVSQPQTTAPTTVTTANPLEDPPPPTTGAVEVY